MVWYGSSSHSQNVRIYRNILTNITKAAKICNICLAQNFEFHFPLLWLVLTMQNYFLKTNFAISYILELEISTFVNLDYLFHQIYRRISLSNKYFRAGSSRTKEYHLAKTMMALVKFILDFHKMLFWKVSCKSWSYLKSYFWLSPKSSSDISFCAALQETPPES